MNPPTHSPGYVEHQPDHGRDDYGGDDHGHDKEVVVTVNKRPVPLPDRVVTGLRVKQAAVAAGLPVDPGFVLLMDGPDGNDRVVGDDDVVKVNKTSSFTAIAPDDNS